MAVPARVPLLGRPWWTLPSGDVDGAAKQWPAVTRGALLGRPVRMEAVPRETWEPLFRSQGMKNPIPRMRMLDGFNEGWIEFENGEGSSRKGKVALKTVLTNLIDRQGS